jgi:trehalose 6-phosphate phosphatase
MNMNQSEPFINPDEFEAIICDLDGVITQTARVHARAWQRMFDKYLKQREERGEGSVPPYQEEDYFRYIDGKPRYDGVQSFLESRGIELPWGSPSDSPEEETVCGLGNSKNSIFRELVVEDGVDVYQENVEVIRQLAGKGWKTGIVSSSRNCRMILQAVGLESLFQTRVDGATEADTGLKGKPASDYFLRAAEKLRIKPEKTVMVEDAVAGVQAGRAGGFGLVVGVDLHDQAETLRKNGAHRVVIKLSELFQRDYLKSSSGRAVDLPNALDKKEEIASRLTGTEPAVFLDYDGTLTPIVAHPEDAVLSVEMRETLRSLAARFTVVIISGRDQGVVRDFVNLKNLVYAGSHGFEITGANLNLQHPGGEEVLHDLYEAGKQLEEPLSSIPGTQIERKKYAVAIHYRNAPEWAEKPVGEIVESVQQKHTNLRITGGKKVIELRPDIDWDKGRALSWLLKELNLDNPGILPLYIGDDLTDEDAFWALQGIGISILVGDHGESTVADYRLDSVDETRVFLNFLMDSRGS